MYGDERIEIELESPDPRIAMVAKNIAENIRAITVWFLIRKGIKKINPAKRMMRFGLGCILEVGGNRQDKRIPPTKAGIVGIMPGKRPLPSCFISPVPTMHKSSAAHLAWLDLNLCNTMKINGQIQ
jgi:hypothetical protein